MDREVFGRGMTLLAVCYPDYVLKDETISAYWEFLRHLSNQEFEAAIKSHISANKWFPKVSEIMDAVKSQRPSARAQWARIIAAAEASAEPEMDAATEKALASVGGFVQVGLTPYDALPFVFKEFERAYREGLDLETRPEIGGPAPRALLEPEI